MLGSRWTHAQLVDMLRRETDYIHEAEMMTRMGRNFEGEDDILFPRVIAELTTPDVLTMTFMEGIKITRFDEIERAGIDRTAIATRLVQSFYKQLFVDHLFHADPHPGNFLVLPGPKIVVLKKGEHGAFLSVGGKGFALPAYPVPEVIDPTGAGDSFAGGLVGWLARQGQIDFQGFKHAMLAGTITASFCVEDFSLDRLKTLDLATFDRRMSEFRQYLTL